MTIYMPVDAEYEAVRLLAPYLTAYCRPLPAEYQLPCVLVSQVGGSESNMLESIDLALDARAETEAEASECLRTAIGILAAMAGSKLPDVMSVPADSGAFYDVLNRVFCTADGGNRKTHIRRVELNSIGSWGRDPFRPDLAMYSARVRVWCHPEKMEV